MTAASSSTKATPRRPWPLVSDDGHLVRLRGRGFGYWAGGSWVDCEPAQLCYLVCPAARAVDDADHAPVYTWYAGAHNVFDPAVLRCTCGRQAAAGDFQRMAPF